MRMQNVSKTFSKINQIQIHQKYLLIHLRAY